MDRINCFIRVWSTEEAFAMNAGAKTTVDRALESRGRTNSDVLYALTRELIEQRYLFRKKPRAIPTARAATTHRRAPPRPETPQGTHVHHVGTEQGERPLTGVREARNPLIQLLRATPAHEGDYYGIPRPRGGHLRDGVIRSG